MTTVGDIDERAVETEQPGFPDRLVRFDRFAQGFSLHFRRNGHTKEIEQGRRDVDRLHQRLTAHSGFRRTRIPYEKRRICEFVVAGHHGFCPPILFTEHETVVGVDDQQRVLPQIVLVEEVDHPPQVAVAHREERRITLARMFDDLLALRNRCIGWPIEVRTVVVVLIQGAEGIRRIERLVRIEGLDLQEPVIHALVGFQEGQPSIEGNILRPGILAPDAFAIFPVVLPPFRVCEFAHGRHMLGHFDLASVTIPRITFLPPDCIPGGIAAVIGGSAVFPIVVVVRNQMGINPPVFQDFRHRVIEGLQRPPAAMQETIAPGMQFPARWHTRQAADIAVVENGGFFTQARKIFCLGPRTTVIG